jgi:hypothetical protein
LIGRRQVSVGAAPCVALREPGGSTWRFAIADSLNKSVEKVIDTIRVRRESVGPAPSETSDATIPEGSEITADVPQLHLAATVAKASEEA